MQSRSVPISIGEVASTFATDAWRVRRVVDSLFPDNPRAGRYRLIAREQMVHIAAELNGRGWFGKAGPCRRKVRKAAVTCAGCCNVREMSETDAAALKGDRCRSCRVRSSNTRRTVKKKGPSADSVFCAEPSKEVQLAIVEYARWTAVRLRVCHDRSNAGELDASSVDWSRVFKRLTYRESQIVKLRWGVGSTDAYSAAQVGRMFKITRERVRQIEAKAMRKLREMASDSGLPRRVESDPQPLAAFGGGEGRPGEA
jgi:hypothetical protein